MIDGRASHGKYTEADQQHADGYQGLHRRHAEYEREDQRWGGAALPQREQGQRQSKSDHNESRMQGRDKEPEPQ